MRKNDMKKILYVGQIAIEGSIVVQLSRQKSKLFIMN